MIILYIINIRQRKQTDFFFGPDKAISDINFYSWRL